MQSTSPSLVPNSTFPVLSRIDHGTGRLVRDAGTDEAVVETEGDVVGHDGVPTSPCRWSAPVYGEDGRGLGVLSSTKRSSVTDNVQRHPLPGLDVRCELARS